MKSDIRILLIPGGGGSGEDHWDHLWESGDVRVERVEQADYNSGTKEQWLNVLDKKINSSTKPVILVAHSLGCILAAHWNNSFNGPVIGALLVAPADIEASWVNKESVYIQFLPIPEKKFHFPTQIVYSTNDPYVSIQRINFFASKWESSIHSIGNKGHIGSKSNLGHWNEGKILLNKLIQKSLRKCSA